MVVGVAGAIFGARRHPGPWMRWFDRALAAAISVAWLVEYVDDAIRGTWSVQFTLPLQLTDVVSLCAIAALLTRRERLIELLYFWALTATLQALLTPDLGVSFPNVLYFTYFTYHAGAIVAACFLVWGNGCIRSGARCGGCSRRRSGGRAWPVWPTSPPGGTTCTSRGSRRMRPC